MIRTVFSVLLAETIQPFRRKRLRRLCRRKLRWRRNDWANRAAAAGWSAFESVVLYLAKLAVSLCFHTGGSIVAARELAPDKDVGAFNPGGDQGTAAA
jgi:hypothetical protein